MPSIQTNGLTKRFGDGVVAVDDLDLVIESGEIFGFPGPNGAGKSTTINILLDFISPTAGRGVFGLDTRTDAPAIRERIGVLPEGYGFDEYLTGREYVEWVIETKAASDPCFTDPRRAGALSLCTARSDLLFSSSSNSFEQSTKAAVATEATKLRRFVPHPVGGYP